MARLGSGASRRYAVRVPKTYPQCGVEQAKRSVTGIAKGINETGAMKKETKTWDSSPEAIARAAVVLRDGGIVAFPTETVYGLGADARNEVAVAAIYATKGRPSVNPLIVHVKDVESAQSITDMPPVAMRLAEAFWPGPLTLVLSLRPGHGLAPSVTAGLPSVGLRVPDAAVAQDMLQAFAGPVAAPSANPSGRISPTTAAHVLAGLSGRIDAVIDGGPCRVGLESTIVDVTRQSPRLLRAGGITADEISLVLGDNLNRQHALVEDNKPTAPGQMSSHYAPRARVRLNAKTAHPGELLLGFGPVTGAEMNLSEEGDLAVAAARLFEMLHLLDGTGAETIAVSPIPETGLGVAINDRLRRAAASTSRADTKLI